MDTDTYVSILGGIHGCNVLITHLPEGGILYSRAPPVQVIDSRPCDGCGSEMGGVSRQLGSAAAQALVPPTLEKQSPQAARNART